MVAAQMAGGALSGAIMGGGGMAVGGGLGTLIIAAIVFFLGGDPSAILNSGISSGAAPTEQRELNTEEKQAGEFMSMLVAENEITWEKIFAENGMQYQAPKVVLFEQITQSGCGTAQSAMGPFYCPADQTIYMDLAFFM